MVIREGAVVDDVDDVEKDGFGRLMKVGWLVDWARGEEERRVEKG